MRRFLRVATVAVVALTLASALAVLGSNLLDPGYRAHYGDSIPLVVLYVAVQAVTLQAFVRDTWLVPWLAVARALCGLLFVATFVPAGPIWMAVTPARYVYQLFDWGEGLEEVLVAMVVLGRGAWNVLNAFYFTEPWWRPLRASSPLLGRLVTAVPIALVVSCVWLFTQMLRVAEATDVARYIYYTLDCATIRAQQGRTTTDVRQRGQRRYDVEIAHGCDRTRVTVRDEDGHIGLAGGPRPECCRDAL